MSSFNSSTNETEEQDNEEVVMGVGDVIESFDESINLDMSTQTVYTNYHKNTQTLFRGKSKVTQTKWNFKSVGTQTSFPCEECKRKKRLREM